MSRPNPLDAPVTIAFIAAPLLVDILPLPTFTVISASAEGDDSVSADATVVLALVEG
jgi:hypothetical protein